MERQVATVAYDGQLTLPAEVQSALGIAPGSEVEIVVHDQEIRLVIQEKRRVSQAETDQIISELRGMFKGEPSLEDEYFRDRDRDKW